ncbi:two-component sensor histidine kinase [Pseudoalteromonas sp. GCY]|uniref:sensor histidine kinase n=1 Tax=Pseudoalteromonas sp. GCY TaxID=2003316 RepID=UPI000BFEB19B|nr:HAMP domain-containing sensor histidine kinase [Pseudoalteromonas sp. GCY]PHI37255.1 two-component sensor histidine kinase [Pseudoalteromonas sp. GCY]QQQ67173.1 HAMP domain-containing histidine kinase [Pseudoalteromonas sp. GCY]
MKLKTKFTLLVALCTFALLGSFYQLSKNSAERTFLAFNKQSAVTFGHSLLDDDLVEEALAGKTFASPEATLTFLASTYPEQLFIWRDANSTSDVKILNPDLTIDYEHVKFGHQFSIHHPGVAAFVVQFNEAQYALPPHGELFWLPEVLLDRSFEKEALQQAMLDDFMLTLVILSIIAALLAWLGSWYFLSPLKQLKRSFKAIESGELDTRLALKRHDEVGEIISSFNNLAAWLQGLHQQYKQMNSDLSHELRTPLNGIRSRLEAMEDGIVPMDKAQLAVISQELHNVNRIIDDLCLLSLTESKQLTLSSTRVNLSELLTSTLVRYQAQAKARGVKLDADIQEGVTVTLDAGRVRQIVVNLLDNAFKYGADGGVVTLKLSYQDNELVIKVADCGQGMSPNQLEQVFERFYRAQGSRHDTSSLGLGLPICRQLAELMGATLTATSTENQGASFSLRFSRLT